LKLYFFGSELLTQLEYEPVAVQAPEEVKYLREIEAHMLAVINRFGIPGLAAPQLGFSIQMVVVKLADGARLTLLNPVIERMYGAETEYPEGCISCPPGGNQCEVARMQFISVSGSSIERPEEVRDWQFTSRDARVVQHEIDHLRGTFFFERADLVEKAKVLDRFHQWRKTFKQNGNGFPFGGGKNGRATRSTQAQHS
jgi:peptide deformylase